MSGTVRSIGGRIAALLLGFSDPMGMSVGGNGIQRHRSRTLRSPGRSSRGCTAAFSLGRRGRADRRALRIGSAPHRPRTSPSLGSIGRGKARSQSSARQPQDRRETRRRFPRRGHPARCRAERRASGSSCPVLSRRTRRRARCRSPTAHRSSERRRPRTALRRRARCPVARRGGLRWRRAARRAGRTRRARGHRRSKRVA